MGKLIHLFSAQSEFEEAYNGDKYKEPWVSYTEQETRVDYNKVYPKIIYKITLTGTTEWNVEKPTRNGAAFTNNVKRAKVDGVEVNNYTVSLGAGEHVIETEVNKGVICGGTFDGATALTDVKFKGDWTIIGNYAFAYCTGLTHIELPSKTLQVIENFAFRGCTNLVIGNMYLPELTFFDNAVFYGAAQQRGTLHLPKIETFGGTFAGFDRIILGGGGGTITTIPGYWAANSPYLKYVDLPDTITDIGEQLLRGCPVIETVIIRATTPPTLGNDAFFSGRRPSIQVPAESVNTYKAATNWSSFANQIVPIP